jgi:hypothetical protein
MGKVLLQRSGRSGVLAAPDRPQTAGQAVFASPQPNRPLWAGQS